MSKQADLIVYMFQTQRHHLSGELLHWLELSPRFTAFVETCRNKIRNIHKPESVHDLRSELEIACCLPWTTGAQLWLNKQARSALPEKIHLTQVSLISWNTTHLGHGL